MGVTELFENGQCMSPGDPGRLEISKGLVSVAERDKGVSFVVTVAELTVEVDGLFVTGYGLPLVAEMAVGVA